MLVPFHWLKSLSVIRMPLYIHLQDENYAIIWNCLAGESILPFKGKMYKRAKNNSKKMRGWLTSQQIWFYLLQQSCLNWAGDGSQGFVQGSCDAWDRNSHSAKSSAPQQSAPTGSSSESWRITLKLQPQMCWEGSSEARWEPRAPSSAACSAGPWDCSQEWCSTPFLSSGCLKLQPDVFAQLINQQKTDAVKCKMMAEHSKGSWFRVSSALRSAACSN